MSGECQELLREVTKELRGNEDPVAWNEAGIMLARRKCYQEALQAFTEATRLDPENAAAWNGKGNALYALRRFEEALQAFTEATRLDPENADAWFNKGIALYALRRFEEALQAFTEAIRLDPELALPWNGKGNALYDLRRFEEALLAYEEAIRLDPENAAAWYNKGIALRSLRRFEEALLAYGEATRLDPEYAAAWNGKGLALRDLRRFEEALLAYEEATRLDPKNTLPWNNKGNALRALRCFEEALLAFDKAIHLNPKCAPAWNGKGNALRALRCFEEALLAYEKAIRLDPEDALPWYNRAKLLFEDLDDTTGALASIRAALRWKRDDPDFWLLAARISLALGMEERANQALQSMLRLLPRGTSLPDQFLVRALLWELGHAILPLRAVSIDPQLIHNEEWRAYLREIKEPLERVFSLWDAAALLEMWDMPCRDFSRGGEREHGLLFEICGDRISARDCYAAWLEQKPASRAARYFLSSAEAFFNSWNDSENNTTGYFDDIRRDAESLLATGGSPEETLCTALSLLLDSNPAAEEKNFSLAWALLAMQAQHAPSLAFLGYIAYIQDQEDLPWEPYIKACLELEQRNSKEKFFSLWEERQEFPVLNAAMASFPELFFRLALLRRFGWLSEWREDVRDGTSQASEDGMEVLRLWETLAARSQDDREEADEEAELPEEGKNDSFAALWLPFLPSFSRQAWKELLTVHALFKKAPKIDECEKRLSEHYRAMFNKFRNRSGTEFLALLDEEIERVVDRDTSPTKLIDLVLWSFWRGKIPLREAVCYMMYLEKNNSKVSRFIRRAATGVLLASTINVATSGLFAAAGLSLVVEAFIEMDGRAALEALVAEVFRPSVDEQTQASGKDKETLAEFRDSMRRMAEKAS